MRKIRPGCTWMYRSAPYRNHEQARPRIAELNEGFQRSFSQFDSACTEFIDTRTLDSIGVLGWPAPCFDLPLHCRSACARPTLRVAASLRALSLERLAWIEHLAAFDDEVELVSRPHGGVRPNNPAAAAKLVRQANDGDRHRLIIAYSQRHQACRSAGRAADQVRTSDQHEDGQSARPHRAALVTRSR
jgi:hypothetical protein